ncbi:GIY-YIG nuclease family protein [Micromonospora sp. NPDC047730]|uniref:GIY-YIG nuclease family protein n=1 Tax=unclassified Micromonospora TaxID=2617518 RepID=UPI00370FCF9E
MEAGLVRDGYGVSMTIPEWRPDHVPGDEAWVEEVLRLLSGVPVGLDVAVKRLSPGSGVYAWWAAPSVFPDLPGPPNENAPSLRLLYLGRATSLRGRILRNHLRRSGSSTLRRTLAGLLLAEGYRTTWTDRVVLVAEDEARLTAWMHTHLRLTWAEDAEPATVEAELVRRVHPPLNVHGVDPEHLQPAVVAAKNSYNASSRPAEPSRTP